MTTTTLDPTLPASLRDVFATMPELAALDRLCARARDAGAELNPAWLVGPLAAHFVGPFCANRPFVDGDQRPGDSAQRTSADSTRHQPRTLANLIRRLAGMEPDADITSAQPSTVPSVLIENGFVGLPIALARPAHDGFTEQVERAAADFKPLRDLCYLDGRLACLQKIGTSITVDHRADFRDDYRLVASTLAGSERWDVEAGWSRQADSMGFPWRVSAVSLRARFLLQYPAALTLIVRAFAPDPTEGAT